MPVPGIPRHVKSNQKLDYGRLADALSERNLVERQPLDHILQQCSATGALMPDLLVREHLISDWELSRVVCELYGLPFVPVHIYPPAEGVLDGLNPDYLRQYSLVPLDRFGGLLTVAMPALVPSSVLEGLSEGQGHMILPAVGTVESNREWLAAHLPPPQMPSLEDIGASLPGGESKADGTTVDIADWGNIFDAGDEAVQDELRKNG